MKIDVGCAEIGIDERRNVLEVINSGWLSPGKFVQAFEKRFALKHDVPYGVMVNSGTDALRIALATLKEVHGWENGDEVIVPALTFIATSNIVLQNGLVPVFVDVERDTFNIDINLAEKAITQKTRCIIPVHLFGKMANLYGLSALCDKYNLKMIEDSCETMGVRYIDGFENGQGKKCYGRYDQNGPIIESPGPGERRIKSVGSFGDISCFSTYACHLIVTGVGGIAITKNPEYEEVMRSYANHGRDPYFLGGYTQQTQKKEPEELIKRRFLYYRVGYSSRVSEFEAAVGLAQLDKLDSIIKRRKSNAIRLDALLKESAHSLRLPSPIEVNTQHAWMMYPIVIQDPDIDRDTFCLELERHGVETRPLMPMLTQPIYQSLFGDLSSYYPNALEASTRGFYIGCHQLLTDKDIAYAADVIKSALKTVKKVPVAH